VLWTRYFRAGSNAFERCNISLGKGRGLVVRHGDIIRRAKFRRNRDDGLPYSNWLIAAGSVGYRRSLTSDMDIDACHQVPQGPPRRFRPKAAARQLRQPCPSGRRVARLGHEIKPAMPDEKPVTDPETIAACVRIARIVYSLDDDQRGPGEIDNPPTVVESLKGAKVRAWLPAAALSSDDDVELDEQRAVKTTPSGEIVARVWLPISHAIVRRRGR
jgi:hypothetical protein